MQFLSSACKWFFWTTQKITLEKLREGIGHRGDAASDVAMRLSWVVIEGVEVRQCQAGSYPSRGTVRAHV